MSVALYEVIDPRGVMYTAGGRDGGKATSLPVGAKIRQADVDKGNFTTGGLESLEKNGRLVSLKDDALDAENKKLLKAQQKEAKLLKKQKKDVQTDEE